MIEIQMSEGCADVLFRNMAKKRYSCMMELGCQN